MSPRTKLINELISTLDELRNLHQKMQPNSGASQREYELFLKQNEKLGNDYRLLVKNIEGLPRDNDVGLEQMKKTLTYNVSIESPRLENIRGKYRVNLSDREKNNLDIEITTLSEKVEHWKLILSLL